MVNKIHEVSLGKRAKSREYGASATVSIYMKADRALYEGHRGISWVRFAPKMLSNFFLRVLSSEHEQSVSELSRFITRLRLY